MRELRYLHSVTITFDELSMHYYTEPRRGAFCGHLTRHTEISPAERRVLVEWARGEGCVRGYGGAFKWWRPDVAQAA